MAGLRAKRSSCCIGRCLLQHLGTALCGCCCRDAHADVMDWCLGLTLLLVDYGGHLEVQDDCPNEPKCKFSIALHNVLGPYVDQFYLEIVCHFDGNSMHKKKHFFVGATPNNTAHFESGESA